MLSIFVPESELGAQKPVPLHAVLPKTLDSFLETLAPAEARWLKATGFAAKEGELALVPAEGGVLGAAVLGLGPGRDPHALALFSEKLPPGLYALGQVPPPFAGARAAYGWAIGTYAFDRYRGQRKKGPRKEHPRLVLPSGVDGEAISRIADGVFLARDLVNTPSNDMGPAELETAARGLAERFGARIEVTTGDALLDANYPMIHAVGRASSRAPRLIDLVWGEDEQPKVTLVGKGVCFDTGGLNIKNASGMSTMKKDMGGAACVLGLAQMIMGAGLPVRLRVLVPAVENSISGSAYRPGDVLASRKGLFVEIGNTDAEGRLVLADALTEADTETPALMFCLATLTGAARAATGMELPPFFHRRRKPRRRSDALRHGGARSGVAASPVALLRAGRGQRHRRYQQRARLSAGGRRHGGAVSEPLHRQHAMLGPFRHSGLDRPAQARAAQGRGSQRHPRNVRRHRGAIRNESVSAVFDSRLTPARPDLAAAHLQGQLTAANFVKGRIAQAMRGVTGLHAAPTADAPLHTQLLFGEIFTIYEEKNGWVWGQAGLDSYVGYARAECFAAHVPATHRVISLATALLAAPDVKKGARDMLPMNAKVACRRRQWPLRAADKRALRFLGPSGPARRARVRLGGGGGAFCRRALSVGRENGGGNRLLGPGADRARSRRDRVPARHRHDGSRIGNRDRARFSV